MHNFEETTQRWLETFLAQQGGTAGTVHRERGGDLYLVAAQNIPEKVLEIVSHVPKGKGMAGQAQVQRKPVQTCKDRKSTRLNSSHIQKSRMPSSA